MVGFQDAVKATQPDLDKVEPKVAKNYFDAASTARELIRATKANGPSAYRLLGIMATLDDLSLDAATAAVTLLIAGKPQDPRIINQVTILMGTKNGCNDIGELIMHATMRLGRVEEDLLEKLKSSYYLSAVQFQHASARCALQGKASESRWDPSKPAIAGGLRGGRKGGG